MLVAVTVMGSSPHTRGAHLYQFRASLPIGIIPAYAGSTSQSFTEQRVSRDHPRIRGEHFATVLFVVVKSGSSPHTRGAPETPGYEVPQGGIIPAYAGSTLDQYCQSLRGRDHPRIRGEHKSTIDFNWDKMGSSPHTRGAQRGRAVRSSARGIIPAYAGSTVNYLRFYLMTLSFFFTIV